MKVLLLVWNKNPDFISIQIPIPKVKNKVFFTVACSFKK